MKDLADIIKILEDNVLPAFGSEDNVEGISNAIDILKSVKWASCITPPKDVSFIDDDGELVYRIIIMSSEVYGLLFVFYDEKTQAWIDAKTGYELTHQPTEDDIWTLLPTFP